MSSFDGDEDVTTALVLRRALPATPRPRRRKRRSLVGLIIGIVAVIILGAVQFMRPTEESGGLLDNISVSGPDWGYASYLPSSPAAGETPSPQPAEPSEPVAARTTAPATAPRTTSKAPAAFTPIVVEAEDPGNYMEGAQRAYCYTCRGGWRVRYVGGANYLTIYADVPSAGTRTLTVTYQSEDVRWLSLYINGSGPIRTEVSPTGGWETPGTVSLTAYVPAGRVAFKFSHDLGPSPDIDQLRIS